MPVRVNSQAKSAVQAKLQGRSHQRTIARFDQILNRQAGRPLSNYQVYRASMAKARLVAKQSSHQAAVQTANPVLNTLSNSGDSAVQINRKLTGTPLAGLGGAFKRAEAHTGVNAYSLAAIAIHESGYGKSSIAKQKNNLFGFQAYDDSPFSSAKQFSSVEDGIFHVAKYLRNHYLSPAGKYYRGTSLQAIGQNYATDPNWATKVAAVADSLVGD